MARRRARNQKRRNNGFQNFMTGLCVVVLLAGGVFFLNEKLESDHVKQTSAELSQRYHAADQAETEAANNGMTTLSVVNDDVVEAQATVRTEIKGEKRSFGEADAVYQTLSAVAEADPMPIVQDMPIVVDVPKVVYAEGAAPDGEFQPRFAEFYAQNNDLVGWIEMADIVSEPILWRDNEFYMDHDFYGKSSQAGAIFLDVRNSGAMTDSAMLIYGHNMRSGAMFGDLDKYRKEDYICEYPVFTIQSAWETEPRQYVLISLFDASMNKSDSSYIRIVRTAFDSDADKESFIAEMRERSIHDIPVEAGAQDQLVTLVTCSYSQNNGRFLLFARELREGETVEQIQEQFRNADL